MESMTLLWQRIEHWLATHAPDLLDNLNPGASEEELAQTDATLGIALPEDFKASYRLHNGGVSLFVGMSESFFPLERVLGEWSVYQDLKEHESGWAEMEPGFLTDPGREHPPIQPVWWHSKLIPFAADGAGNNWCVDLEPALGGHVGQVIDWDHEDGPTTVLFESFEALLAQLADDLEAGKYLSFGFRLEERLTQGKEARDQAKRYDFEQPSPGKEILEQEVQPEGRGRILSEDKKILLYMQSMIRFVQVLQMEQGSRVDRFRAYHSLIYSHLLVATAKSTGQVLSETSLQQIEEPHRETHRKEAERLLAAFEAEANQMPPEHWVYDDLKWDRAEVFRARHVLDFAQHMVAEGNLQGAVMVLSLDMQNYQEWFTPEEQLEIYALMIDLHIQQQQREQARDALARFTAAAQKKPPEDPVHDTVRDFTIRLQQVSGEQDQ